MKLGKSLVDLATEIQRQSTSKRDFIAPTTQLHMTTVGDPNDADQKLETEMQVNGQGRFGIRPSAHQQIAARLGVPVKYYQRMQTDAPELLATNVNHWLSQTDEKRMVRTLDGNVRGFLSSRYRTLDNLDLAETVLPIIQQSGCRVESAEITETRLYIKAVTERVTTEIVKGDVVQAGIVISNSEIGFGSVKVEPMVYRLVCLNGMIAADAAMKKYHVGRGAGDGGDLAQEFFKDETRKADDRAFWLKVRDVVNGAFDAAIFDRIVNSMREATSRVITGDPVKVVEVTQRQFGLTDGERGSVLTHLIKGGDLTQYGLMNAITRASQDIVDYDRATEFERLGGQVIELGKTDWRHIAEAA